MNATVQQTFPGQNEKHIFSVMILERNQTHLLKEFIQHYLEEGADHFFIYNGFDSPLIHNELACVPSALYTVLPYMLNITSSSKIRQTVYEYARPKTKWLAVIDSDDYISSRAEPGKTIREVLEEGMLGICDIVSIPSINFGWGNVQKTPTGQMRQTLMQRWGYERKFEERLKNTSNSTAVKKSSANHRSIKFSDSFDRVKNKVIVKTTNVDKVRTNSASMKKTGTVCVASTTPTQACVDRARATTDAVITTVTAQPTPKAAAAAGNNSTAATHLAPLPKYCPAHNLYRSRRSSSSVYLLEQDIPGLALAGHHYRIPSWEEWQKRAHRRPEHYREQDARLANRLDVNDNFMQLREQVRQSHALHRQVKTTLQACGTITTTMTSTDRVQGAPQPQKAPRRERKRGERRPPPLANTTTDSSTDTAAGSTGDSSSSSSSESAPLTGIPLIDKLYQFFLHVIRLL